jgi:hypothetical protein
VLGSLLVSQDRIEQVSMDVGPRNQLQLVPILNSNQSH